MIVWAPERGDAAGHYHSCDDEGKEWTRKKAVMTAAAVGDDDAGAAVWDHM